MSFLSGEFLWLLLAVPALVGAYLLALRRSRLALRYTDVGLVRAGMGRRERVRRHLPPLLMLLALIALLFAIARPVAVLTLLSPQRTIILAMDVSLSMAATDIAPSRLAAAQSAAQAFVKAQPRDVRVGVVAFAGTANLVQAPTNNHLRLLEALHSLQLQYQTAIGSGLVAALAALFPDARLERDYDIFGFGRHERVRSVAQGKAEKKTGEQTRRGSAAIILLTDGSPTSGVDPLSAARMAAERGVPIYTVGFGTPRGGAVGIDGWSMHVGFDEALLKDIAEMTGGAYFQADSAARLKDLYKDLSAQLVPKRKETELTALFTAVAAALALLSAALSLAWSNRLA